MVGIFPGLGVEIGVMDQLRGVVVIVKDVPLGVEGANFKGMMSQEGRAHAGEIGIGIEALIDFVVVGLQVEAGFGAVYQHDAEAPEIGRVMGVGGRLG